MLGAMPKRSSGFTLVELMVVITIIAILSVVGVTVFSGVQKSARDAKRRADLDAIRLALEQYKTTNNTYPAACQLFSVWDATDWALPVGGAPGGNLYTGLIGGGFMKDLPSDPVNKETPPGNFLADNAPADLGYLYCSDGTTFILGTNLETDTTVEAGNGANYGNYQIRNQQ